MNFENFTDTDLLDFYQKRKDIFPKKAKQAFKILYGKHFASAYSLALRYTNDKDEALSLINDTFIRIVEDNVNLKSKVTFSTYLMSVVKNRAFNSLRSSRNIEDLVVENIRLDLGTYSKEIEKYEMEDLINNLGVSNQEKEIIRLRIAGFKNKEIAEKLGIRINTLYAKLKNLKEKIKIE